MDEGIISKRYAKALLEYAVAREEDKVIYERMKLLFRSLQETLQLREVLQNSMVSQEDKLMLIKTASGGAEMEESALKFMKLVFRNERGGLMHDMALSYMILYREMKRITVVSLITAVPVSESVYDRIMREVGRRTRGPVEMETHVDPGIEGGLIFQIDDLRLDASVRSQLEQIRRQFIQKNRIIV